MKKLTAELRKETSQLCSKSFGPIGFDYRRRTKLERLLFLIAKECCTEKIKYNLGGLSYTHQKMFLEYVQQYSCDTKVVQIVKSAFEISDLICAISSSDPYAREGALEKLGGTVLAMFENLGNKIKQFLSNVESVALPSQ